MLGIGSGLLGRRLLLLCCLIAFGCNESYSGKPAPKVEKGVLDLQGWDFERDGPVPLDGEWRFRWGEVLEPAPWTTLSAQLKSFTRVPNEWKPDYSAMDHRDSFQPHGVATFGFEIRNSPAKFPALLFPAFSTAAEVSMISLTGEVLTQKSRGVLGTSSSSTVPCYRCTLKVPAPETRGGSSRGESTQDWFVLVSIANFHDAFGGVWDVPVLMVPSDLDDRQDKERFRSQVMFGVLLIIGLYHLILFGQRKEDRGALFFGTMCLVMSARVFVMSVASEIGVAEEAQFYETFAFIEYLAMPAGMIALLAFIDELLPAPWLSKVFKVWGVGFGMPLIALALLTPKAVFGEWLNTYQVHLLGAIGVVLVHLIIESLPANWIARWCLGAFSLMSIGIINDVLHSQELIETAHIAPYTMIGFVLTQAGILAARNAAIAEERDANSRELLATYRQLDDELLKRETLESINQQLEEDNQAAAQQLIQADKLATLGTLVAGVAHDIANPATLIVGSTAMMNTSRQTLRDGLETLLEDETDEDIVALREHFRSTLDALDTESANIKLGVSRITAINSAIRNQARSDQSLSQVPLRDLIDECLTVVGHRLRNVDVDVDCSPSLTVGLIRSQFGQVLMNLIANAADAIAEHGGAERRGRIQIVAEAGFNQSFQLTIEDDGPGIPEELREKILEPFFTTKGVGKGTGLGMSIVLRILEAHSMTLVIEDSPNLGGARLVLKTTKVIGVSNEQSVQ